MDRGLGALKGASAELAGEVRVGATNTFNLGFIPACAAAFVDRHPTAKVIVAELPAAEIGARLNADELDLGIAYRPAGPSDLWFEPL